MNSPEMWSVAGLTVSTLEGGMAAQCSPVKTIVRTSRKTIVPRTSNHRRSARCAIARDGEGLTSSRLVAMRLTSLHNASWQVHQHVEEEVERHHCGRGDSCNGDCTDGTLLHDPLDVHVAARFIARSHRVPSRIQVVSACRSESGIAVWGGIGTAPHLPELPAFTLVANSGALTFPAYLDRMSFQAGPTVACDAWWHAAHAYFVASASFALAGRDDRPSVRASNSPIRTWEFLEDDWIELRFTSTTRAGSFTTSTLWVPSSSCQ